MDRFGNLWGNRFISNIVPVLCGFIGVLLAAIPVSSLSGFVPAPLYALMAIYFWCLVRPDLMTPLWVFLIGLCYDLIAGPPIGLWAASFVATYAVIDQQRDNFAGLSGIGAMIGFAMAVFVTCLTYYAVFCLYRWQILPPGDLIKEFAVTVIAYIPLLFALDWIHRHFVGPARRDF